VVIVAGNAGVLVAPRVLVTAGFVSVLIAAGTLGLSVTFATVELSPNGRSSSADGPASDWQPETANSVKIAKTSEICNIRGGILLFYQLWRLFCTPGSDRSTDSHAWSNRFEN